MTQNPDKNPGMMKQSRYFRPMFLRDGGSPSESLVPFSGSIRNLLESLGCRLQPYYIHKRNHRRTKADSLGAQVIRKDLSDIYELCSCSAYQQEGRQVGEGSILPSRPIVTNGT